MEFYIKRELPQIQRWTQSKSQRNTREKSSSLRERESTKSTIMYLTMTPKQKTIQTKFIGKMILGD